MSNPMEAFMWTALVGGVVAALKLLPEMIVGFVDRIERIRETGFRGDRLTPVPAHTVERLSRRRSRR